MKLDYLITGTGRCGTVYCAKYLTATGIPCGHEAIFDYKGLEVALKRLEGIEPLALSEVSQMRVLPDGKVNRLEAYVDLAQLRGDSSYLAAPFLDHPQLQDTKVLHVVRSPVSVIRSFCQYLGYFQSSQPHSTNEITRRYEAFMYSFVPELQSQWLKQFDRCALYYIKWNRLIQDKLKDHDSLLLRVEDAAVKLGELLGSATPNIPKDENTFYRGKAGTFTLDDISSKYIRSELVSYAKEWGYTL
jgi:hypothetical protein